MGKKCLLMEGKTCGVIFCSFYGFMAVHDLCDINEFLETCICKHSWWFQRDSAVLSFRIQAVSSPNVLYSVDRSQHIWPTDSLFPEQQNCTIPLIYPSPRRAIPISMIKVSRTGGVVCFEWPNGKTGGQAKICGRVPPPVGNRQTATNCAYYFDLHIYFIVLNLNGTIMFYNLWVLLLFQDGT